MTDRQLAKARKIGQMARARLDELKIAPSPENYMVWYHYFADEIPSLKRSIDILVSNRQEFSPEVCLDLYNRFFAVDRQTVTLRQLSSKIETAVSDAVGVLSRAGDSARQYGAALSDTADGIGGDTNIDLIREVVRRVMTETQTMIDRSDILEKQLSQSTAEIGELRKQIEDASREAMTDPLTGIGNRKAFDYQMKQNMQVSMEQGSDLCLLILDIDHFKRFNDTYGHQFGDMVLRLVAKGLVEGIRGSDQATRYGGEEFAILLPETTLPAAATVGDHLRTAIATKMLVKRDTRENLGTVTISVGVSSYRLGEPPHQFIERADAALYKAKQTGRNRVLTELDLESGEKASGEHAPANEDVAESEASEVPPLF